METVTTKRRFIELRAKGWSYDKIAKELSKAKQTLIDWGKELEEEIANLKAVELEALYEEYYLLKEQRLQSLGNTLSKLREEIEGRDLSDLSTDKLLEIYLKYSNQVSQEIVEPTFKTSEEIKTDRIDRELLEELTSLHSRQERKLKVG